MLALGSSAASRAAIALLGAVALMAALLHAPAAAQPEGTGLAANVIDVDGEPLGTVTFTAAPGGGTFVDAELEGLPPGFHGFHVHANGECDPAAEGGPFLTAGGHLGHDPEDPGTTPHHDHAGDLPVLYVDMDGAARQRVHTDRFTVQELFGRALIVHAAPDNYANIPDRYSSSAEGAPATGPDAATLATGDAGGRIACGEIEVPALTQPALPEGEVTRTTIPVDPQGRISAVVSFTEVEGGLLVEATAAGLTEGFHGFHLHQGPSCTDETGAPDFGAAQGHWNPGETPHGAHHGDMPVLLAGEDGTASLSYVTDLATLADLDDRAVMIHAGPDNYGNIPDRYTSEDADAPGPDEATLSHGDAGARAACGLVDGTALRLAGADRFETGVAISQASFVDGTADAVVLARADRFPDGLAGTPLASAASGPLLLTDSDELDEASATELQRVLPEGGTVYLLGGEAALSAGVETAVQALGFATERLEGATRIETALAVAEKVEELLAPDGPTLPYLITTGDRFPDALAAGAAAGEIGGAVLLTPSEERHSAVDDFLAEREDADLFAVGGPAARPYDEATPVFGDNRIETSVAVAEEFFRPSTAVSVARQGAAGDDADTAFADALTGGAHAALVGGPVLLSQADVLAPEVRAYVEDDAAHILLGYLYGGVHVLAPQVHADLQAALHP